MITEKIVAECWTCAGMSYDRTRHLLIRDQETAERHRHKGHDVRPVRGAERTVTHDSSRRSLVALSNVRSRNESCMRVLRTGALRMPTRAARGGIR